METRNEHLHILILEDMPADAELMEEELRDAGLSFVSKRVDKKLTFTRALEEFAPDLILSDYSLPSFDGDSALKIAEDLKPDPPSSLFREPLEKNSQSNCCERELRIMC